jgi:hypothetical protein
VTAAIRREFVQNIDWVKRLPQGRQLMLEKEIVEAKARDAFVESILFTQFADKTTILKKSGSFSWSRSEFERDLKSIQKLRDALAHANEYANSHESALRVCKTVRLIDLWKGRLVAWQPALFPVSTSETD